MEILVDYMMVYDGDEIVKGMLAMHDHGLYSSKQIRKEKNSQHRLFHIEGICSQGDSMLLNEG